MSDPYRMTLIYAVPDYDRWAEAMATRRRSLPGVLAVDVYRSIDDPDEVMVELVVESPDVAREVITAPELRDFLDRAGLDIYPPVFIGTRIDDLSDDRRTR